MMRDYRVHTSFTEGWYCERHQVSASSIEEACLAALEAVGESQDNWTVGEPGDTIVDRVTELRGDREIPQPVPERFREIVEVASLRVRQKALEYLIERIISQVGDQIQPNLLAEVHTWLVEKDPS